MMYAGRSDIGRARSVNEDSYFIMANEQGCLMGVICDGIGGSKAGEVASSLAIEVLKECFLQVPVFEKDYEVKAFIQTSLNRANDSIYNQALQNPERKGMGTTAVGVFICPLGTYIFNVGDSRIYAVYTDGMVQMSVDHSLIERMIQSGEITAEEASRHAERNRLTNALGIWKVFRIDIDKIDARYEQLLLCSDGLSGYVSNERIESVLRRPTLEAGEKVDALISLANDAGGHDNITVIVVDEGRRKS